MRELLVITHPEASHHVDNLVGGWHDSELTPAGRQSAQAIGDALRAAIPTSATPQLITSDLLRARQTADIIGAHLGITAVADERLREKSYGAAEGQPRAWLDERFVPPPQEGERLDHHEGIDDAETMGDLARRVYAAVQELLGQPAEYQVVSTHGGALTFVIAAFLRVPVDALSHLRMQARPGGITTLRIDDQLHNRTLVSLSSVEHLVQPVA